MIHLFLFILVSIFSLSFIFVSHLKMSGSNLTKLVFPKKADFFEPKRLISKLIYIITTFEWLLDTNPKVWLFWDLGFASWILGCCFWVLKVDAISTIFILASIIFCSLTIVVISQDNFVEFSIFRKVKLGSLVSFILISISVVTMVLSNSFASGIVTFMLLWISLYTWRQYENRNTK
jgi:hypothetical protein